MSTTTGSGPGSTPTGRGLRLRSEANPTGAMTIGQHLRELRSRTLKSALAILVGSVVGWIYYQQVFEVLRYPINDIVSEAQSQGADVKLILTGVAQAFTLQLQISATVGVIIASPVWIYQMWRFITPGLRRHERMWAYFFVGTAVPLFLGGVATAYWVLPKALAVLFGFTPENVPNYVPVDTYLSFFLRMCLVFGIGFLAPLVLVALNLVGVLSGKRLAGAWRVIIFSVFLFAAIATPTGDPINLALLAGPIFILVGLALTFCFLNDRRRAARSEEPGYDSWQDDETSPI